LKAIPEAICGPCTLEAVYRTIRLATRNPILQKKIMNKAISILARGMANDVKPARIATDIYRIIYAMSNNPDPIQRGKEEKQQDRLKAGSFNRKWIEEAAR